MKQIDYMFEPQIKSKIMNQTKANNMYPLLKEMKNDGLIESYDGIHRKKEVKIYRLTEKGKNTLDLIIKEQQFNIKRSIWIELFDDFGIMMKKE